MKLEVHLQFNGTCKEAFEFYSNSLGGTIEYLLTYGESPAGENMPAEHKDKIVHGSIRVGDLIIAGADVFADYQRPYGFSLILQLHSEEDCREKFELLAKGGETIMPLQRTFWSSAYGMVRDKFEIPWEVNCSLVGQP